MFTMSSTMKGLLKGLRFISQIFEEEEEEEMQIGFPTDVKHVAHIGWDGPAANAPSWIQSFKDGESGESPRNGDQQNVPGERGLRFTAQENRCLMGSDASTFESSSRRRSNKVKGAKRHALAGSSTDSPRRSTTTASENKTDDTTSSSKTLRRRKTKTSSKSKPKPTSTRPNLAYSDPGIE
ncbi:CRIB domain-containing protein RIC5-like [Silene latifolia]|uniref:CRIB domain-containing protein RIC5-like n=1 Tax=Silene latifolia TaxID=37657 RepID=UPI003D789F6A